ncbi:MAG: RNA pseudouridine synthase [Phascolarctobacterium sp.]|nr:RNA pseudouridine synthase [Phascolarctobacterium sp.]
MKRTGLHLNAIAYEDEYILIVDKPAGISIHPTVNEQENTLYNYVENYYLKKNISSGIHPVSRLDRNTSGLVTFAKSPSIQNWLSHQTIIKEYLGITTGYLPTDEGIIEASIARKEGSIIERRISANGKYAKTAYKVLERYRNKTFIQIRLFTGRTHQIRVHLAYIGYPIYNDSLYGSPGPQRRHALHACKVSFSHHANDRLLEVTRAMLDDLRKIIY